MNVCEYINMCANVCLSTYDHMCVCIQKLSLFLCSHYMWIKLNKLVQITYFSSLQK